jgi:hypothetical protein
LLNQTDRAVKAFDNSYKQQKTSIQLEAWQRHFNLKWPRDDWASARKQQWFSRRVNN